MSFWTLSNWLKLYRDEGIKGLCRKPSNKVLRNHPGKVDWNGCPT